MGSYEDQGLVPEGLSQDLQLEDGRIGSGLQWHCCYSD